MKVGNHLPMHATRDDVEALLEKIRAFASDPEVAHAMEADLWEGVLRAIASGKVWGADATRLAEMALKSKRIKFARWRA